MTERERMEIEHLLENRWGSNIKHEQQFSLEPFIHASGRILGVQIIRTIFGLIELIFGYNHRNDDCTIDINGILQPIARLWLMFGCVSSILICLHLIFYYCIKYSCVKVPLCFDFQRKIFMTFWICEITFHISTMLTILFYFLLGYTTTCNPFITAISITCTFGFSCFYLFIGKRIYNDARNNGESVDLCGFSYDEN